LTRHKIIRYVPYPVGSLFQVIAGTFEGELSKLGRGEVLTADPSKEISHHLPYV
jgi:hypothetical protein